MTNNKDTNRPIIGVTSYGRHQDGDQFYLPTGYVDAVRNAGGTPIILPPGESDLEAILHLLNGLIFAGGGDIDPSRYGGSPHPKVDRVNPERDSFELELARRAFDENKPIMGICRGFQLLNVASGGDLIQHVPEVFGDAVQHRREDGKAAQHKVTIQPESRLAQIVGRDQISVKSKHHQALGKIPSEWRVAARAADGVVEAVEHQHLPWAVSVLWHPELSLDDPNHQKLFQALIMEAAKSRRNAS